MNICPLIRSTVIFQLLTNGILQLCKTLIFDFLWVNICLPPVILVISSLQPCKKNCLDSNLIIWRLFDFRPSWHQITEFKVLSTYVI